MKNKRKEKIQLLNDNLEKIQVEAIDGSLYIKREKHRTQFYHQRYIEGKATRRYIPMSDMNLARRLAQQSYNRSVRTLLSSIKGKEMRIEDIDRAIDEVLLQLVPERRALITPVQPTLQEKLAAWKNRSYQGRSFRQDDPRIYTNNHERVRSKTEKIIADALEKAGVTYKYEAPLLMEDGATVYPDFTFFDPSAEKEFYWEHFGLIGDSNYMVNAVKKIRAYERNGFQLGYRLFATFEGGGLGPDYERIDDLIKTILVPLIPPQVRTPS
ncbi:hypothetical protein [Kallipyga gabonensis]|uniref:hypothetical protein n=1 Tax=Kallipyga gabonensis TaxID=1686287 RepID=UPI0012B8D04F|nr:hypothetical protein [Kallipyga gabonensis]